MTRLGDVVVPVPDGFGYCKRECRLMAFYIYRTVVLCVLLVFPAGSIILADEPADEPSVPAVQSAKDAANTSDNVPSEPDDLGRLLDSSRILFPDGFTIGGRNAKLVQHPEDARWFLVFESLFDSLVSADIVKAESQGAVAIGELEKSDEESGPAIVENGRVDPFSVPLEVLPGRWLIVMNKITGNSTDLSVTFRVWAEVTTYHGRNYVLPADVKQSSLFRAGDSSLPDPKTADPKGKTDNLGRNNQMTEQLRSALLAVPRTRSLNWLEDSLTDDSTEQLDDGRQEYSEQSTVLKNEGQLLRKDGEMVVDRLGRMQYESGDERWVFIFESDGQSQAAPPLSLHPNLLLEVMERQINRSARQMRFRVSGLVTTYQGREYMLLRKVMMVYDLGNLGK